LEDDAPASPVISPNEVSARFPSGLPKLTLLNALKNSAPEFHRQPVAQLGVLDRSQIYLQEPRSAQNILSRITEGFQSIRHKRTRLEPFRNFGRMGTTAAQDGLLKRVAGARSARSATPRAPNELASQSDEN